MTMCLKKYLSPKRYISRFLRIFIYFISLFLGKINLILIREVAQLGRKRKIDVLHPEHPDLDYVRLATLELVAHEIIENNVPGAIAELGVSSGEFAKHIGTCFPDRKFYLFDTFEGFDDRDCKIEQERGHKSLYQKFEVNDIRTVLKKIPQSNRCIVRKGYFPESATVEKIDDVFSFVSIDADLFQPVYEGLKFFYPKLSPGGYIFIHDYNQSWYTGAKEAVQKFCKESEIGFVPLTDYGGTAIIVKNKEDGK